MIIRFAILFRMVADDHQAVEKKSEQFIEEAFTLLILANMHQALEEETET